MSVYSESMFCVYGINISTKKAVKKDKVRGCRHEIDLNKKFCQECGKATFVEKEFLITDLFNSEQKDAISIFCADQEKFSEKIGEVVVGFCVGKYNKRKVKDFEKLDVLSQSQLQEKKQSLIKFLNMNCIEYKEEDIGYYTVIESI